MIKYKLTKRGKIVIVMLCAFIAFFISLDIFYKKDNVPKYDDYSKPNNIEQQQVITPEPPPVVVVEEEPWEQLQVAVYFEANMTSFDKQYHEALNIFTDVALKHDDIKIQVEGNCATLFPTSKKQKALNYNLSLLRAQAIAEYIKSKGISAERLIIVGNGSDKPLKDNASPKDRKFNRRVDIYFVNK